MDDSSSKMSRFLERLKNQYRLVILNNETFEEVANFRVSLQNIYLLLSSVFVFLSLIIILIIFYTPVRQLVPGYGELSDNSRFIELNKNLDTISLALEAQELYLSSFRKMITIDEIPDDSEPTEREKLMDAISESIESNRELSTSTLPALTTNAVKTKNIRKLQQDFLQPPVTGLISLNFTPNLKHFGVDILAPSNTPIKAIKDGFVISSGWNLETGNTLGIQHADNMVSFYKHNSALLKEVGAHVKAGEAVAIIGNTGTLSDGPHLHFELWYNGNPVNPLDYINFE